MHDPQMELDFPPPKQHALLTPGEVFDRISQELLETLGEDNRLERKPAGIHGEELGKYICMWANTAPGGGLMVIGVSDNGDMLGCHAASHDHLNRLENPQDLCPDAKCETKRIRVVLKDGKEDFVLVIRTHYNDRRVVKTPKGEVWVRRGDQKKRLTLEEVRELQMDKGEVSYEQEPCGLAYPGDFDTGAVRAFADRVRSILDTNASDEDILVAKHLAVRSGDGLAANIACALLFSKEPDRLIPGCKIRFLRFDGEHEGAGERFNVVKDIWIENKTIPRLIQEASVVLESQIRTFSALSNDGKFYTAAEYPKAAWYEAIVNACVHRSYGNGLKNMNIFVKMFDDRLVIESPGPFPPLVTPESIVQGVSHPRNPKLMHAMYFMDFVKMVGEGTRRMRETMRSMDLPAPEYEEKQLDSSRVRVTLRNNIRVRREWVDADVVPVVGAAIAASLDEQEKRIVNFAAENGRINVSQTVRLCCIAWETAKRKLQGLADRDIFEHVHRTDIERDPQAHYILRIAPTSSDGKSPISSSPQDPA